MTATFPTQRPVRCPSCDAMVVPVQNYCPKCGGSLTAGSATMPVKRRPLIVPGTRQGDRSFPRGTGTLLQFLPSGLCVALALERPVILGREPTSDTDDTLDLTELNALQHGVSRHHCQLRRVNNYLVVRDLNSTNGTYLNDEQIDANTDHIIAHGDKLILGTLHLTVSFTGQPC